MSTLGKLGGMLLGTVFLIAALAKAWAPGAFAQQIEQEGLNFYLSASVVVIVALALETFLGMALVLGIRRFWLLGPAAALVTFFLFLTGRNYWLVQQGLRDENTSCGCFGSLLDRTSGEALWQDFLILVPLLWLALWTVTSGFRPLPKIRLALALITALTVSVFAWRHPDLQLIDEAARIAAQGTDEGFLLSGDYLLFVDNLQVPAKIYHSDKGVEFLILSPELSFPVLLRLLTRTIHRMDPSDIVLHSHGRVDLLPTAKALEKDQFEVLGNGVTFSLHDHQVQLRNNPPLLNLQNAANLQLHTPEFRWGATDYQVDEQAIKDMFAYPEATTVRVYLGSWSDRCKQLVPRLMEIEHRLQESSMRFEYYGLPPVFQNDPDVIENGVKQLPTAIVYMKGQEVGRLVGEDWKRPERALAMILGP